MHKDEMNSSTLPAMQSFWRHPLVLVFVSIVVSTGISTAVMSFGWKASIDTFNATTAVKLQQDEEKIRTLEQRDSDRIKASDLAMRDEVINTKLTLLQSEIADIKEQVRKR